MNLKAGIVIVTVSSEMSSCISCVLCVLGDEVGGEGLLIHLKGGS